MTSPFWIWRTLSGLPPALRRMLAAMTLVKFASTMIWPFFSVMMSRQFGTGLLEIGGLLSAAALTALLASPVSGLIADRLNRLILMRGAALLPVAALTLMGLIPDPAVWSMGVLIVALGNGALEPLLRAALSDAADTPDQRPVLFHLRYYLVNLAAALGPLAGIWFAEQQEGAVFFIAAAAYLGLAASLPTGHQPSQATPAARFPGPVRQRWFWGVFAANLLLVLLYALTDEPLTLHLLSLKVEEIARIIALITLTNSIMVLTVHLLLMRWLVGAPPRTAFLLALVCLAGGLTVIAINRDQLLILWLAGIACATLAEIIAMPMLLSLVDRLAPAESRNGYFGLYILSNGGGAFAPILAAAVIELWGGGILFAAGALLSLLTGAAGYCLLPRPQPLPVPRSGADPA